MNLNIRISETLRQKMLNWAVKHGFVAQSGQKTPNMSGFVLSAAETCGKLATEDFAYLQSLDQPPFLKHDLAAAAEFEQLRQYSHRHLAGRFTVAELFTLLETFKSVELDLVMQLTPSVFLAQLEDAERFEATATFRQANLPQLIEKLRPLTDIQFYFLYKTIKTFWVTDRDLLKIKWLTKYEKQ